MRRRAVSLAPLAPCSRASARLPTPFAASECPALSFEHYTVALLPAGARAEAGSGLQVVLDTLEYGSAIKKTPVVVGNCTGFAVNRVFFPYTQARPPPAPHSSPIPGKCTCGTAGHRGSLCQYSF